ncbi:hypothetical protein ACI784_09265 [Geodermatophilus sp. SYSU D01186]
MAAAVMLAIGPQPRDLTGFGGMVLRIFAAWAFAFAPGWLFVLFLQQRAPTIWGTYVVQLYRLGVDRPGNLPPPPVDSPYYALWQDDGGEDGAGRDLVYRRKFESVYGPSVSRVAMDRMARVGLDSLVPAFVLSGLLSVGWTVLLWLVPPVDLGAGPNSVWTSVAFSFLGAYTLALWILVRRYLTDELHARSYLTIAAYIVAILLVTAAVHPLLTRLGVAGGVRAAITYLIGGLALFIPGVLRRLVIAPAARLVQRSVPALRSQYPLRDLDGMNVWYEARLLGEGIEDMQDLTTLDILDLLLRTRIPAGRLVDWIDQACLYVHLGADGNLRDKLRRLGIRAATDLLDVLPAGGTASRSPLSEHSRAALAALEAEGVDQAVIRNLVEVVADEPNLRFVRNWKRPPEWERRPTSRTDDPTPPRAVTGPTG